MMPRRSADGMDDAYPSQQQQQQQHRPSPSAGSSRNPTAGDFPSEERRFAMQQQQRQQEAAPMTPRGSAAAAGMTAMEQSMLGATGGAQQHPSVAGTMGYRGGAPYPHQFPPPHAPDIMTQSPNLNFNLAELSPGIAARMQQQISHTSLYPGPGGAAPGSHQASPGFGGSSALGLSGLDTASAAAADVAAARGLPQAAPGAAAGGMSVQADREEELLLNLLIARRQRGRATGSEGAGSVSLSDELMRLRQNRAAASGQIGLPPIPPMPPLFSDTAAMSSTLPPSVSQYHPQGYHHPGIFPSAMDRSDSSAAALSHHPIPMNLSTTPLQQQEASERIDRSPTRLLDARTQEHMRDMRDIPSGSHRGIKRGMLGETYEEANLKLQAALEAQGLEMPAASPTKKKRTHKKKPADMPRRPLSAYNLFFSEERERILKEIEAKEGGGGGGGGATIKTEEAKEEEAKGEEEEEESKPKAMQRPLIPSQKKRRPHRKTHGKISFQQLARMVGERWKSLPQDRRKYYQDLAQEDMKRQKIAMEEYYAKQNAAKAPSAEEEKDSDPKEQALV